jgi:hypothetical protein
VREDVRHRQSFGDFGVAQQQRLFRVEGTVQVERSALTRAHEGGCCERLGQRADVEDGVRRDRQLPRSVAVGVAALVQRPAVLPDRDGDAGVRRNAAGLLLLRDRRADAVVE